MGNFGYHLFSTILSNFIINSKSRITDCSFLCRMEGLFLYEYFTSLFESDLTWDDVDSGHYVLTEMLKGNLNHLP